MKCFIFHFIVVVFLVLCFFGAVYMNSKESENQPEETNFSTEVILPKMGQ